MFSLEAHETARDSDASWFRAGSEAPNRGELWRVAIENHGQSKVGRVLFKRENQPLLVAAVAEKTPFRSYALGEKFLDFSTEPRGLRMTLADCLSNQKWARSLFLSERFEPRQSGELARFEVFLSPHGWGLWRQLSWNESPLSYQQSEFAFPPVPAGELARVEAAKLLSRLFCQHEESADFRFAREFLTLSEEEQTAHLWSWKRGDLAQMQSVLRTALLAQDELWREPRALTWRIDLWRQEPFAQLVCEQARTNVPIRMPALLEKAFQRALACFGPQIQHEEHARHLSLTHLFNTQHQKLRVLIEVREPSAHERLEAMLEWREWLEETQ